MDNQIGYAKGDLLRVTLVDGETVRTVTARVKEDDEGDLYVPYAGQLTNTWTGTNDLLRDGWKIEVLERAHSHQVEQAKEAGLFPGKLGNLR